MKAVWSSVIKEYLGLFVVMVGGIPLMLKLYADSLDTQ